MQNYAHIANRGTLSSAIQVAMQRNYLQRVEEGIFDQNAGVRSRPATYGLMWLNEAEAASHSQKNVPGKIQGPERSENQTGNGQKNVPDRRSEKRTDIQITETNNTLKQQGRVAAGVERIHPADQTAVAFNRLREAGFDTPAARALATRYPFDQIDRQLAWIDQRRVRSNRLGMLRLAIERDWSAPATRDRTLERPNLAAHERGVTFADALQRAQQRLVDGHPSTSTT
jgi:hypothetical protein